MLDIHDMGGQLFHTYSTESSADAGADTHLASMLKGGLQLTPHPEQLIGPEFDWAVDPLKDANWRFQYHCLVWLDRLLIASKQASSSEGICLYERLMRSWVDENTLADPPSDYSWFDMAVGMRAIVLLRAVEHFGPQEWLVESITVHGEHLADPNNYEGKGNHSLHQDMGLLAIGQFLERRDWVDLAQERILTMLEEAIDEEGVSQEGSIDYQYRNYRWYSEAAKRLELATGVVPSRIADALQEMPIFMAHATSPSGMYALLGDTLEHRAPIVPGTATEWVKDSSRAPDDLVRVYEAGYIFARSRWETWKENKHVSYLTMRFGPGRAHAVHGHEDAGSITLDAYGEKLLCDSGLYAYEAGDFRQFFRGRSSHNVIDVVGRKYYPSADSPLVAFEYRDRHLMVTIHVKGLEGVSWHRTLLYSLDDKYLVVDDRVQNRNEDEVVQRWQLPKGASFTNSPESNTTEVISAQGNIIRFHSLGHSPVPRVSIGMEKPISAWRSESYRERFPSPELSLTMKGRSVRFSTLIDIEGADDRTQDLEVSDVKRGTQELAFRLRRGDWQRSITLSSTQFSTAQ